MVVPLNWNIGARGDQLLALIPEFSYGVEVGAFRGELAEYLLTNRPGLRLVLNDVWQAPAKGSSYAQSGDPHADVTDEEHEALFRETVERMAPFAGRAEIMRMPSIAAAARFPYQSIDWVFIDAEHTYDAVTADLHAWAPRVRAGGLVMGHDYLNHVYEGLGHEVKRAVDEFFGAEPALGEDSIWFVRI